MGTFHQGLLPKENQQALFSLARRSIESKLFSKPQPNQSDFPQDIFKEKYGVFVTLKLKQHLKGCIGVILTEESLFKSIQEMAVQSAFFDPRFPKLTKDEYPQLHVEISLLSRPEIIKTIDQVEVGKHGLIISKGFNKGLLLPQVAIEHKWNRLEFLEHTCLKANLPVDAYKSPNTVIEIFSADVYEE